MNKLNPNWIVGFVDGDGHFGFSNNNKTFYFVVSQDKISVNVLYAIKEFFQCGSVHKAGKNMREYKVSSKKHLENIIIPFFKKYQLQTSKRQSFENFVNTLNTNLLLDYKPIDYLNIYWLIGFIDAEGCFVCSLINRTIRPQFIIGLKATDKDIIKKIKHFLGFGISYTRKNSVEVFQLSSNKNMCTFARKVILTNGFKDNLKTFKRIRARKWCKIVFLMEKKEHKTIDGFNKIKKLLINF